MDAIWEIIAVNDPHCVLKLHRGNRPLEPAFLTAVPLHEHDFYRADHLVETEVKIDNFAFAPHRVVVKAGTTVTWVNDDDIPHTIASSTKLFKSNALDTKDKFSFTFTTPGAYEYFCSLHPHMTGTIVVEAATGSRAAQSRAC